MAVRQTGARFMGKHVGAMLHNTPEMLCVFGALTGQCLVFNCCKAYGLPELPFLPHESELTGTAEEAWMSSSYPWATNWNVLMLVRK